jgi:SAM-dependent methyltransferase
LLSRAKRLTPILKSILEPDTSLLDLGCGDMVLTEHMHFNSTIDITPIDTVDSNLSSLSLTLYDGERLPFDDKSFDATLVSFVLHHCTDIPKVLDEIIRVTRKKIIVLEEIYAGMLSRALLLLHDYGNRLLSSKMDIPLNFMTNENWLNTFEALGLKIMQNQRIYQYPILNMTHQILFELQIR